MPQTAPISPVGGQSAGQSSSTQDAAQSAFGLGFEDLLRIVLTQLTYQDPLKPVENFEFVSQLAQFTQIQQTQTMSDRMATLTQAGAISQATGLLSRKVDISSGNSTLTGVVKSITFQSGEPRLTILTANNQTISNVALSAVNKIAEN
ncbi:MAG TPA: flagellar hook capping FlgD N-terminal domain-containing protein [Hyphomonadaceae bacterium]|jgi:flagellar basal-body rod modification protein FlgD|nr:flagellar hook capping FlgD N-terminal domain-containing protein [Hyphomonadaceae bacterium]